MLRATLHRQNKLFCNAFSTSVRASYNVTRANYATREQSVAPLAPIGVRAAMLAAQGDETVRPKPKIFDEFAVTDRVGIISGGNGGLGLEMGLALCEAGARAIYCLDVQDRPSKAWEAARQFVSRMEHGSRLEYRSVDVTDQKGLWGAVEEIADKEKRMDVCIAAAGILKPDIDCLEYPGETFRQVIEVNTTGVFFTAQAAGRQMRRFKQPGSIVLIASLSGTVQNRGHQWVAYNTSKSSVLQMARSMACELAPEGIRVNTLSPGHIYTPMTAMYIDEHPEYLDHWSNLNPMNRIGRPDELRGVITWLASDASSYCTGADIIVDGGHRAW